MRSPSAWLAASSCVLVLAGCGQSSPRHAKPPPQIPRDVAQRLSADADAIASATGCAARDPAVRLRTDVLATIARIPQRYREQLMSAANDVVTRIPPCPPPEHGHGKHKGHGKHDKHDNTD
jgi:hypothetical protein